MTEIDYIELLYYPFIDWCNQIKYETSMNKDKVYDAQFGIDTDYFNENGVRGYRSIIDLIYEVANMNYFEYNSSGADEFIDIMSYELKYDYNIFKDIDSSINRTKLMIEDKRKNFVMSLLDKDEVKKYNNLKIMYDMEKYMSGGDKFKIKFDDMPEVFNIDGYDRVIEHFCKIKFGYDVRVFINYAKQTVYFYKKIPFVTKETLLRVWNESLIRKFYPNPRILFNKYELYDVALIRGIERMETFKEEFIKEFPNETYDERKKSVYGTKFMEGLR